MRLSLPNMVWVWISICLVGCDANSFDNVQNISAKTTLSATLACDPVPDGDGCFVRRLVGYTINIYCVKKEDGLEKLVTNVFAVNDWWDNHFTYNIYISKNSEENCADIEAATQACDALTASDESGRSPVLEAMDRFCLNSFYSETAMRTIAYCRSVGAEARYSCALDNIERGCAYKKYNDWISLKTGEILPRK